jgi:hypothetical protein
MGRRGRPSGSTIALVNPVNPVDSADSADSATSETSPEVAATVRLLHRRRGWIWTAVGSAVAWLVTLGLLGSLDPNASGAAIAVPAIFVLLLTAVFFVALVASIVDTVRLRRRDPHVRRQAGGRVAHHPVRAHAYRYPPRNRFTWLFAWAFMAILVGIGVAVLPGFVDGVAYVTGAESNATFVPVSYGQQCGKSGCWTVTNGYLESGSAAFSGSVGGAPGDSFAGGTSLTWPGQVPLGQPFTVRAPLMDWGFGSTLIDGDGTAIGYILAGVLLDGGAVLVLFAAYKLLRNWLRHRRQGAVSAVPGVSA